MTDPGLDLHEWETRWSDLQDQAADAPDEALPEIVRLVEEMLVERGYDLEGPAVEGGEGQDVVRDFLAAREIARAAETTKLEQEDVHTALGNLADIHDYLTEERAAP